MDNHHKGQQKPAEKKGYQKPMVEKHKAAAIVAGSGCSSYKSESTGSGYYH